MHEDFFVCDIATMGLAQESGAVKAAYLENEGAAAVGKAQEVNSLLVDPLPANLVQPTKRSAAQPVPVEQMRSRNFRLLFSSKQGKVTHRSFRHAEAHEAPPGEEHRPAMLLASCYRFQYIVYCFHARPGIGRLIVVQSHVWQCWVAVTEAFLAENESLTHSDAASVCQKAF